MKSTPEQTAARRELKRIARELMELAHRRNPEIAPRGLWRNRTTPMIKGGDFDEFYEIQHESKTIPAVETGGKVRLRCRRREIVGKGYLTIWHYWEPAYAATKPESVAELLPVVRAHVEALKA